MVLYIPGGAGFLNHKQYVESTINSSILPIPSDYSNPSLYIMVGQPTPSNVPPPQKKRSNDQGLLTIGFP